MQNLFLLQKKDLKRRYMQRMKRGGRKACRGKKTSTPLGEGNKIVLLPSFKGLSSVREQRKNVSASSLPSNSTSPVMIKPRIKNKKAKSFKISKKSSVCAKKTRIKKSRCDTPYKPAVCPVRSSLLIKKKLQFSESFSTSKSVSYNRKCTVHDKYPTNNYNEEEFWNSESESSDFDKESAELSSNPNVTESCNSESSNVSLCTGAIKHVEVPQYARENKSGSLETVLFRERSLPEKLYDNIKESKLSETKRKNVNNSATLVSGAKEEVVEDLNGEVHDETIQNKCHVPENTEEVREISDSSEFITEKVADILKSNVYEDLLESNLSSEYINESVTKKSILDDMNALEAEMSDNVSCTLIYSCKNYCSSKYLENDEKSIKISPENIESYKAYETETISTKAKDLAMVEKHPGFLAKSVDTSIYTIESNTDNSIKRHQKIKDVTAEVIKPSHRKKNNANFKEKYNDKESNLGFRKHAAHPIFEEITEKKINSVKRQVQNIRIGHTSDEVNALFKKPSQMSKVGMKKSKGKKSIQKSSFSKQMDYTETGGMIKTLKKSLYPCSSTPFDSPEAGLQKLPQVFQDLSPLTKSNSKSRIQNELEDDILRTSLKVRKTYIKSKTNPAKRKENKKWTEFSKAHSKKHLSMETNGMMFNSNSSKASNLSNSIHDHEIFRTPASSYVANAPIDDIIKLRYESFREKLHKKEVGRKKIKRHVKSISKKWLKSKKLQELEEHFHEISKISLCIETAIGNQK